ncbi:flavin-binding monooxygenase-like [Pseudozyma hubeiensis SY62]|uniref:Flavin-binding monooxygenase-like n=1 Tax=Pseudozyma hubeiensis (strain SY62) TaxID=1305764 RepID=R9PCN3_PSEHS|nr:flavin-binding monooxygenase-like [Pseudozyma hubeiensis SY62]GAC99131.1 flavin-binding monooxygenase-like [Pseudozyma hubeiensis SY62]
MTEHYDAVVVGGGFAGIYHLYMLRKLGFKVHLYDAAADFGGIWRLNCYPGARVDSEVPLYGLSFPEVWRSWNFSCKYPDYKELRQYFNHLDEKLQLRKDCSFNHRVHSAHWDDAAQQWTVTAGPSKDKTVTATAQHVIFCLGFASKVNIPNIPGMDKYKGQIIHTGEWEESIDCTGKKVAVIGTGASGIQVSQEIGPLVDRLTVFVRTPNLALPMRQQKLDASAQEAFKDIYPEIFDKRKKTFGGFHYDFDPRATLSVSDEERQQVFEELWARGGFHFWLETFHDLYADKAANKTAYDFWQKKVEQRIQDPKKREILCPKEWPHTFGTVRPSLEQNYYEVMNQDNVEIVSIKRGGDEGIKELTEKGVLLNSGREVELDQIILATGFDTHTGGFKQIDIRGKDGLPLTEKWSQGCNSLNGLNTSKFPNLFFLYGPHGPTAYSNGPSTVEVQAEWVCEFIKYMRDNKIASFDVQGEAEAKFGEHINELSAKTLFHESHGWYMGRNIPGKPVQALNFTGGIPMYVTELAECKKQGYAGYDLVKA